MCKNLLIKFNKLSKIKKILFLIPSILILVILILFIKNPNTTPIFITTNEKDHFIFYETYDNFPDPFYSYKIYERKGIKQEHIINGYMSGNTPRYKELISNYIVYSWGNIQVKMYSNNDYTEFIYKTSKEDKFIYKFYRHFLYEHKKDDFKEKYKLLIPIYRKMLKSCNLNTFNVATIFLIMIDDDESFDLILKNIKLVNIKNQKNIIDYIKNYPHSTKTLDINKLIDVY